MSANLPFKDAGVEIRITNQILDDVTPTTSEQVRMQVDFNLKRSLGLLIT